MLCVPACGLGPLALRVHGRQRPQRQHVTAAAVAHKSPQLRTSVATLPTSRTKHGIAFVPLRGGSVTRGRRTRVAVSASFMQSAAELWNAVTQASLILGGIAVLAGLVAWQTQQGRAWMSQTWSEFRASSDFGFAVQLAQYGVLVTVATVFEKITGMRVLGFVYMGIFATSVLNFLNRGIKLIPSPEEARSRVVALEHKAPYVSPPPAPLAGIFRFRFPDVDPEDEHLVHAARATRVLPDGSATEGTAFLTPSFLYFAGDQLGVEERIEFAGVQGVQPQGTAGAQEAFAVLQMGQGAVEFKVDGSAAPVPFTQLVAAYQAFSTAPSAPGGARAA